MTLWIIIGVASVLGMIMWAVLRARGAQRKGNDGVTSMASGDGDSPAGGDHCDSGGHDSGGGGDGAGGGGD